MSLLDENIWKRLLENDSKLKDLAVKAGVENNAQRAQELSRCLAINCGEGVVKSKEELELATYLFCANFNNEYYKSAIRGRIIAAREAGIKITDI